ncbi:MAG: hypothetical protein AAF969_05940 [Bacteroidota bacterium]
MRYVPLIVLVWIGSYGNSQTVLQWSDLSEGISWERSSPDALFPGFQRATFSPEMKNLEGKQVIITGHLLVLDGKQSVYLLSKNPMASCFFCGNGGPETIVDLTFDEKPSFVMDELLSVKGILYLNANNPNACYYRIENVDALSLE